MSTDTQFTHLCPWWMAYFFDNPLRRLFHNPHHLFSAYLAPGMTAVDVGCGMGYFSIGMAKIVGPSGRVWAVDVQEKILQVATRRFKRAGVDGIVMPHQCRPDVLGVSGPVDFVLSFWSLHEMPDPVSTVRQVADMLKPEGHYFLAEPKNHVKPRYFERLSGFVQSAGLVRVARPGVALSTAAVFRKP
ncbi:class I SAM-dependent methyltransferase [Desulfosudis oleivorans]|uniref:Methyltransferase type 11 n=1 Tax=Desulfosudis oleivorans (strain DSM 6200 / JCM 39069 / Hxd3) TaxID=96561 RepID=A9A073_DESOH|nr:methyltransferase domain-containing protein [Desulfosudis oleivorans]ABW68992.1 Methyltransferase type 11 [Desulfosudis oleivorans Hxd3]